MSEREFDAGNARTWNERERATYETGYAEGGRSSDVDWQDALDRQIKRAEGLERDLADLTVAYTDALGERDEARAQTLEAVARAILAEGGGRTQTNP